MDVFDDYGNLRCPDSDVWVDERAENEAAEGEWLEQQRRDRMESFLERNPE